ncbi:MAG: hypothetical protein JSR82_10325 [Verrucomicrobia bacterium]|nr:hypothetical protein [Verrucomicrobiota bacterium]
MDDNFSDLQKLLRLKRYEAPPPEYFENFLQQFQARQRQELVKLPLWRIVWDRLSASLAPTEMPQLGYAAACAVALFAAVAASNQILRSPAPEPTVATVAVTPQVTNPGSLRVATPVSSGGDSFASVSLPLNRTAQPLRVLPGNPVVFLNDVELPSLEETRRAALRGTAPKSPRYVLDSRPVSYAAPASF